MEASGVTLELALPLRWTPRESFPPQEVAEWMRGNVALLKALAAFECPTRETEPEAGMDPVLARLEAKIDLALTLLGELARRHQPLPEPVAVTLTNATVSWAGKAPAPQTTGVLTLYLSPPLPWPLQLPVEILPAGEDRVHARLLHLDEETQTWLDRTLFRHHRRRLAARSR